MNPYEVRVRVGFKEGILDPQADATFAALHKLNFESLKNVRVEKAFVLDIEAKDEASAIEIAREAAQKLLANLVMESFEVELLQ